MVLLKSLFNIFLINLWAQMIIWHNLSLHLPEYANSNLNLCLLSSHVSIYLWKKISLWFKVEKLIVLAIILIINIEWTVLYNVCQKTPLNTASSITLHQLQTRKYEPPSEAWRYMLCKCFNSSLLEPRT